MLFAEKSVDGSGFIFLSGKSKNQGPGGEKCTAAGEVIECAGGLLGLPVFLRYGNRIGEGGFWGSFFGRSASWHRLVIPIYFMYGNRMTVGNRNEVKI